MSKTSILIPVIRERMYLAVFRNKAVTVKTNGPVQYTAYICTLKGSSQHCPGVVPCTPVQFLGNKASSFTWSQNTNLSQSHICPTVFSSVTTKTMKLSNLAPSYINFKASTRVMWTLPCNSENNLYMIQQYGFELTGI